MDVLELKDLSFAYGNSKEFVLQNLNLKISKGDYLLVLGPNGGGKSTFLKLIVGLLKPSLGSIIRSGIDDRSQLQEIGYLPQHTNPNPDFPVSVKDVVLMGRSRKLKKLWRNSIKDQESAEEVLELVE
ncbi:MAG: ATP-binding cassette domain-containing protein, partial [Proteobacteria bacterium]|nr:ATP-binding cassette domain-containing protein [Pseudomonadota bacterium]